MRNLFEERKKKSELCFDDFSSVSTQFFQFSWASWARVRQARVTDGCFSMSAVAEITEKNNTRSQDEETRTTKIVVKTEAENNNRKSLKVEAEPEVKKDGQKANFPVKEEDDETKKSYNNYARNWLLVHK